MRVEGSDVSAGEPAGGSNVQVKEEPKGVPVELLGVKSAAALEQHIREKVRESMGLLLEEMLVKFQKVPRVMETLELVKDAAEKMMGTRTSAPEVELPKAQQKYKLKFNHKCLALGCMEPKCDLCEANPRRRCHSDFDKKYFKGDILKSKCGGSIYVELVDAETEQRVIDPEMDRQIAMSILDGNRYDHIFPHAPPQCGAKGLELCALLTGTEGRPLLQSQDRTANKADGQIVVTLQRGVVMLPDLSVQYSSEALLSGRRPPFRLLVQLVSTGAQDKTVVIPAVSDGFVVASGRSRLAQKKHIPSVDDPVSRLENMGKERVKKLRDLRGTACSMGVDLPDGHWTIIKVGDFRLLALDADKDGQLRQKMLHILKMSEKAWDETRDHALMAVTNDTRMRAWYRKSNVAVGLVYSCYLGETDLDRAVALIEGDEIHLKEHLTPDQRNLVRTLQKEAYDCWWQPGHPGWTFYPFDSESFKQSPSLLAPPKKEYGKSVSMEITRQDPSLVKFSNSETLSGRPLVPVLQSTPLSATGRVEDVAKERDDSEEGNKRIRMERTKSPGFQRKVQSPFEEEDRQRSILQSVSSFKSYCSTSGNYVPRDGIPESYNSFPSPHLAQHDKDGTARHSQMGRRNKFGKQSKSQSSGFEVQSDTLLKNFNEMFTGMRKRDGESEDSADVGVGHYARASSEQIQKQDLMMPTCYRPISSAGIPTKITQIGGSGLQGLKACILSDEPSDEHHMEGSIYKLNSSSIERGSSKGTPLTSKYRDRKRRQTWRSSTQSDLKQKDSESSLPDCIDESILHSIAMAPKRQRTVNAMERPRASQSLEIPPSIIQR